jgi:hypothetical protein
MADGQEQSKPDANANANSGGKADVASKTDQHPLSKTYSEADLQREADRRVNEAQKKWRAEQDALLADKTKDAEAKILALSEENAEATRFADFVDVASKSGIRNLKAAYMVAVGGEYLDAKGKFDLKTFQTDNPEFFGVSANANAGAGAGGGSVHTNDINALIRAAAGRG